ncbi:MAG: DUF308 domain-containing protein [Saccharofermentans sp.]|nr:DUF308 domain-containing protein [Saccharofermentans sp.]
MSSDSIKSWRNGTIISSLLILLLGISFIVWPKESAELLARILALVVLGAGLVELVLFFWGKRGGFTDVIALASSAVLLCISIFLLLRPDMLINFFNVVFGIVIIIIGIQHVGQSLFIVRYARELWWISFLIGIAAVAMGILVLINPFSATNAAMMLIGVTMIIEGVAGLYSVPALKARK